MSELWGIMYVYGADFHVYVITNTLNKPRKVRPA
jgi:hypothetical protein